MKILLPLFFISFTLNVFAQVNSVMPNEATMFYNNAMRVIKPDIKNCIEKNANKLKGRNINPDSLKIVLRKEVLFKNVNEVDLQGIVVLIMVQVSKNADHDLKNLVTNRKNNQIESVDIDPSVQKQNFEKSVHQIIVNKSQIAESVSIVIKNLGGTPQSIIEKFK